MSQYVGLLLPYIIGFIVVFGLFLLFRELFCWYWKINKGLLLLEEQNELLQRLLNGGNQQTKAQTTTQSRELRELKNQPGEASWEQSAMQSGDYSYSVTEKPSKGPYVYVAPELRTQNATIENSSTGEKYENIELVFIDGVMGSIYYRHAENEYFFKNKSSFNATCYFYNNFSNCVNAFHSYLTTGRVLNVGYEGSYS